MTSRGFVTNTPSTGNVLPPSNVYPVPTCPTPARSGTPHVRNSSCSWCTTVLTLIVLLLLTEIKDATANQDAKRLFDTLFNKMQYNKLIRPAPPKKHENDINPLVVRLGMRLAQLIDVDEKNEIMTTNMWVIHRWPDHNLRWNPEEFGGVKELFVNSNDIWLPDIVLYNNADGDYTVTLMTKATLTHTGEVIWEPPAIYKSQCDINVEYFPFDVQECTLKFGSWSYDGFQVDIRHVWTEILAENDTEPIDVGIDLRNYYTHVEWDVMSVPAKKSVIQYPCCQEPFPDITFTIKLRRKTLFYIVNLIIPCVSINMLTLLAFYLPAESNEKISLSTSILLSLSLFQLLLMDSTPATSLVIPLLGKYILFTMILVAASILLSVVTMNIHHRRGSMHTMSNFTRVIFLNILPTILCMKRPEYKSRHSDDFDCDMFNTDNDLGSPGMSTSPSSASAACAEHQHLHHQHHQTPSGDGIAGENSMHRRNRHNSSDADVELNRFYSTNSGGVRSRVTSSFVGTEDCLRNSNMSIFCESCSRRTLTTYPSHVQKAFNSVCFVAKHLQSDVQSTYIKDEWKYITMVVDRLLLYLYILVCFVGTIGLILQAPALFDNSQPITSSFTKNEDPTQPIQSREPANV